SPSTLSGARGVCASWVSAIPLAAHRAATASVLAPKVVRMLMFLDKAEDSPCHPGDRTGRYVRGNPPNFLVRTILTRDARGAPSVRQARAFRRRSAGSGVRGSQFLRAMAGDPA